MIKLYAGTDARIKMDLGSLVFDGLDDIIVGFKIGDILLKTCRKTFTGQKIVEEVSGEPNKCVCRLFRNETVKWPEGILKIEVTTVADVADFDEGMHSPTVRSVAEFENLLTKKE